MKMLNQLLAGPALTAIMLLASPFAITKASAAAAPLPLTILTTALPQGSVGVAYAASISVAGGTPPYVFQAVGSLPPGVNFNAAAGTFAGVPTTAGLYAFLVQVNDSASSPQQIANLSIQIGASTSTLTISTAPNLPAGSVASAYSQALTATGGTTPYVWSVSSGSLPPGLSLSSTGVIAGTPTTQGTSSFSILLTDSAARTAIQNFSLTIGAVSSNRTGVISQVASGGGWKTSIYLVNTWTAPVPVTVKFWSNAGALLPLPVTVTQNGVSQTVNNSTVVGTLPVNDTLLLETDTGASIETSGWAEVISTGPVTGYGVFHYTSPAGAESEGTVPMESQYSPTFLLPYDGVGGFTTGVALTNLVPGFSASVTATVWGNGGKQLAAQKITLQPGGHTSFLLSTSFPGTVGNRGIVQFTAPSTGLIIGLGLRVNPAGGITSIPLLQRP